MAVIVNGDGILTGISSLATSLTDITSGRGTVTGVATVGTLQLGAGVSISSPRSQQAAIFTNNTEFLTVDDAGRVGVGTITPNSDAHPQNEKKINVGFITARSIAGDIDANTMVVAGVSTFVGALNATSVSGGTISGTTGTFSSTVSVNSGNLDINDSIRHVGDDNTKIRFPTADTFTVETAGSERLRIDDNGKVLIATDTTSEAHANQDELIIGKTTDDANHGLTIVTPDDRYGTVAFSDGSGGTSQGLLEYNHSGDFFRIYTAGAEKLRISSGGFVMIGTTTEGFATYGDKFTIANSGHCGMTIRSGASNYGTIYFSDGDDGSAAEVRGFVDYNHATNMMQLGTDGATRIRITSTGEMGVNTAAPVEKLGIDGNIRFVNANGDTSRITALPSGSYNVGNSGGSAIAFHRVADGGGGSDEIAFETHWQGNFHGERLRIEKNGDLKVNGGDLYFGTAGKGIVLGATSNTAANTLDDYEEGNFNIGVTDSNNTFTTGQETGRYIKIGHVVHCTFNINCAISGTSGYAFFLTGFPFTVKDYGSNTNEGLGTCKGTGQEIQLEAQQNNTTVKARNPTSGSAMSVNDIGCTNNTVKSVRGYIVYHTT